MTRLRTSVWMLGLLLACETQSPSPGLVDAGLQPDVALGGCEADANESPGSAEELEIGAVGEGFICTTRDADWFRFEVPASTPLIKWRLTTEDDLTPVTYYVEITSSAGDVLQRLTDPAGGRRQVEMGGVVRAPAAGSYFVAVRDVEALRVDAFNPYQVMVELLEDPDSYEANDARGEQKLLDEDCAQGYLAYEGDKDWFAVQMPDKPLVELSLSVDAQALIQPRYEIFLEGGEEAVLGGTERSLHALEPESLLSVLIHDPEGHSDLEAGYRLCARFLDEPDPHDQQTRNDRPVARGPEAAERTLAPGESLNGALIASLGDRDWYRVRGAEGIGPGQPGLFELELSFELPPEDPCLQLAFALIKGHPGTLCSEDSDCGTLEQGCLNDASCPGHVCDRAKRKCAGAGVCLPEGVCGYNTYASLLEENLRPDERCSSERTVLKARGPLFEGGDYHLLVYDVQDDAYDLAVPYAVRWDSFLEPEAGEPNGEYIPYRRGGRSNGANAGMAKQVPVESVVRNEEGVVEEIQFECVEGYISYPGDQDWFFLPLPDYADSPRGDWHFEFDYSGALGNRPAENLALSYTLYAGNVDSPHLGWIEGASHPRVGGPIQAEGVWGGSECAYICHIIPRPLWLRVVESSHLLYDDQRSYSVCPKLTRGCRSSLCPCETACAPEEEEEEEEGEEDSAED